MRTTATQGKGARRKANKTAKASKAKTVAETLAEMRGGTLYATPDQVATLTGQHRATIYKLVSAGKIPCLRLNSAVRIRWEDVEALLDRANAAN